MSVSKPKFLKLVLFVAGIAFVILGVMAVVWLIDAMNPYNDMSFDAKIWQDSELGSDERQHMAQDLVRNHIRYGMTQTQIESLLGPPDDLVSGPRIDNGLQIPAAYSNMYDLGSPPTIAMEDARVF